MVNTRSVNEKRMELLSEFFPSQVPIRGFLLPPPEEATTNTMTTTKMIAVKASHGQGRRCARGTLKLGVAPLAESAAPQVVQKCALGGTDAPQEVQYMGQPSFYVEFTIIIVKIFTKINSKFIYLVN